MLIHLWPDGSLSHYCIRVYIARVKIAIFRNFRKEKVSPLCSWHIGISLWNFVFKLAVSQGDVVEIRTGRSKVKMRKES